MNNNRKKSRKTCIAVNGKTVCFSSSRLEQFFEQNHPHDVSPWRIFKIMSEFVSGFEFLKKYRGRAISFFGTARCDFKKKVYQDAEKLAYRLSRMGFTIITGGGPGVMEAANKGAFQAGGKSIGINIRIKNEQRINKFVRESETFDYFFTRKVMLSFSSLVYVFYPGGYGTLDELFEMLTLVQTEKIARIPIILVGKRFWTPLLRWIEDSLYKENQAIDKKDMDIYMLADDGDAAYEFIKKFVKEGKI